MKIFGLRCYLLVSFVLFLLAAFNNLLRLAFACHITVNGVTVPMWLSAVGLVVAGLMGFWGYKLWECKRKCCPLEKPADQLPPPPPTPMS